MSRISDIIVMTIFLSILAMVPFGIYLIWVAFNSPLWPGVGEAIFGFLLVVVGLVLDAIMFAGSNRF